MKLGSLQVQVQVELSIESMNGIMKSFEKSDYKDKLENSDSDYRHSN